MNNNKIAYFCGEIKTVTVLAVRNAGNRLESSHHQSCPDWRFCFLKENLAVWLTKFADSGRNSIINEYISRMAEYLMIHHAR